jgi:hypothetical protein
MPLSTNVTRAHPEELEPQIDRWYVTDAGVRFKFLGEWSWIMGSDWVFARVLPEGGQPRDASINMRTTLPVRPWWAMLWRWLTGAAHRERLALAEHAGLRIYPDGREPEVWAPSSPTAGGGEAPNGDKP